MGYPIEIANRMPDKQPVPVIDPLTRLWNGLKSLVQHCWNGLQRAVGLGHRRTCKADHPQRYAQGIDRRRPNLQSGDSRHLTCRDLEQLIR